jgi:hypothetical protein
MLVLSAVSYSQLTTATKVKAVVSDLPSTMNAGKTYKFNAQ